MVDYVQHICKNKKCDRAWVDEDLTNVKTRPPNWKYCEECCKEYGYVNPSFPPKKEASPEQLENLRKGRESLAKKWKKSNDSDK